VGASTVRGQGLFRAGCFWGSDLATLGNTVDVRMQTGIADDGFDTPREPESIVAEGTPVMSVYDELKMMAHRELHRSRAHTLNTTSLVHELYMKMCLSEDLSFAESVKFFA
jgi:hypothetical protein